LRLEKTFACPLCGSSTIITLENGVSCCADCGCVLELERIEERRFIKRIEDDKGEIRRKSILEVYQSEEQKIERILDQITKNLRITENIRREAVRISLKALKNSKMKRTDKHVLVAYSIVLASRENNNPVDVNQMLKVLRELGKRKRMRDFMKVARAFERAGLKFPKIKIDFYIDSIISKLFSMEEIRRKFKNTFEIAETRMKIREIALKLLRKIPRNWIVGKRPYSVAAALVYIAESELSKLENRRRMFSQRMLAECIDQSEYTIKERVADLYSLGLTLSE